MPIKRRQSPRVGKALLVEVLPGVYRIMSHLPAIYITSQEVRDPEEAERIVNESKGTLDLEKRDTLEEEIVYFREFQVNRRLSFHRLRGPLIGTADTNRRVRGALAKWWNGNSHELRKMRLVFHPSAPRSWFMIEAPEGWNAWDYEGLEWYLRGSNANGVTNKILGSEGVAIKNEYFMTVLRPNRDRPKRPLSAIRFDELENETEATGVEKAWEIANLDFPPVILMRKESRHETLPSGLLQANKRIYQIADYYKSQMCLGDILYVGVDMGDGWLKPAGKEWVKL